MLDVTLFPFASPSCPEAHRRPNIFTVMSNRLHHIPRIPISFPRADFTALGVKSEGMSGSDVGGVVKEALMEPLRKCR